MAELIDIAIHESGDGGEINIVNEDVNTIQGLTNQVYLALFGNYEQVTTNQLTGVERFDYWGNAYLLSENQFNSTFEKTINEVALTSGGVNRLVDAAKTDFR